MQRKVFHGAIITLIITLLLTACSKDTNQRDKNDSPESLTSQIYLYGEAHSVEKILDRELELWYNYYHEEGMRHLFIELPYYTAEYLNMWLQSDSDNILDEIYRDLAGTAVQDPSFKEFYKEIKDKCPETIFHGTDVGHQYFSTGVRYLIYLRSNNLKDSEEYMLAQANIEQGKYYYEHSDDVYRENMMVENFVREFDKLNGESIMGIYGAAHTGLDSNDYTNSVPCMANQLKNHYGNNIYSEDLTLLLKNNDSNRAELIIDPYRTDIININGKDYEASYFGKQNLSEYFKEYSHREFWCLENSYEDFSDKSKTGDLLPYDNYPMKIEKGQVFVIDYTKIDGSVIRKYYRYDGYLWNSTPTTEEFILE